MKIRFSLGVLGPSGHDLAQGEFSFFSFAMVSCVRTFALTSKMDEAGVRWTRKSDARGDQGWPIAVRTSSWQSSDTAIAVMGRVLKSRLPLPFSGGRIVFACPGLIVEKWQFSGTYV